MQRDKFTDRYQALEEKAEQRKPDERVQQYRAAIRNDPNIIELLGCGREAVHPGGCQMRTAPRRSCNRWDSDRTAASATAASSQEPTCARLVISSNAHIDVPLYAIPDAEFEKLEKQMRTFDGMARDAARADSVDRWEELPSDCVLLAHREKDWISSDPRKIHDWFREAIKVYDQVLRRACRYLKAWRDHHRPHLDDVSSILLMVCAFEAFEDIGRPNVPARDDLALLRIVERLPHLLAGPVHNPSDREERVDARLTDAGRRVAIDMAKKLDAELTEIIEKCFDPEEAVRRMTAFFGDRIPDRADLVDVTKAARAELRSHDPRIAAAPMVGKSTSA